MLRFIRTQRLPRYSRRGPCAPKCQQSPRVARQRAGIGTPCALARVAASRTASGIPPRSST
eukprot:2099940-Pyramimonas_sp.AAC.1